MDALLNQLGLDKSFFIELALFAVLFVAMSRLYFRPFLKLFEARYQRTIEDREAAEKLMKQANAQFEEYKRLLAEERQVMKKEYELTLSEAKKQEAEWLAKTREEAKKITQSAIESIKKQQNEIRNQLESDVESVANSVSEKLLSRKL